MELEGGVVRWFVRRSGNGNYVGEIKVMLWKTVIKEIPFYTFPAFPGVPSSFNWSIHLRNQDAEEACLRDLMMGVNCA